MKTNVSIKFNSVEEYREIEQKLEELGYVNDKSYNEDELKDYSQGYVHISNFNNFFIFLKILKIFFQLIFL